MISHKKKENSPRGWRDSLLIDDQDLFTCDEVIFLLYRSPLGTVRALDRDILV